LGSSLALVRSASLNGYLELAQSVGLDAHAMLRRASVPRRSLDDPESLVGTDAVRRLLEASAQASGVEDFGLRLASRRQLSNLGPVSLVLREEPTARQALDTLCRYLRLLNAALLTHVEEQDGLTIIREDILSGPSMPARQSTELAVGVMHRILAELLGPRWRPQRVCFRHRPPRDPLAHREFFGAPVEFNTHFNGLVCRSDDLSAPMPGQDLGMARFARHYLENALMREREGTEATVRQLIVLLLPGGRCTSQQVAQQLGMDRRTLHRRLAAEGLRFSTVLQKTRSELVLRQVQDSDLPLTEVATMLGFSAPSAFSHWFASTFGCSVTQWRKRSGAGAQRGC
jgi:AraC-like DNA-binding protein